MIHVDLPYDYGTFVKVKCEKYQTEYCGTVAAYTVTDDGYLVWVSAYKESMTGEWLPEHITPMTESEIQELISKYK